MRACPVRPPLRRPDDRTALCALQPSPERRRPTRRSPLPGRPPSARPAGSASPAPAVPLAQPPAASGLWRLHLQSRRCLPVPGKRCANYYLAKRGAKVLLVRSPLTKSGLAPGGRRWRGGGAIDIYFLKMPFSLKLPYLNVIITVIMYIQITC